MPAAKASSIRKGVVGVIFDLKSDSQQPLAIVSFKIIRLVFYLFIQSLKALALPWLIVSFSGIGGAVNTSSLLYSIVL